MKAVFPKVLVALNLLSLDVALGAWACGNMAGIALRVRMPWLWQVALPISAWIVYTADHLMDAYLLGKSARTPRHSFHVQYFRTIVALWGGLSIISALIFPFMLPLEIVFAGVLLGMFSLIHFGFVYWVRESNSIFFLKEWGVGCIYTLGIWLPPLAVKYVSYPGFFPPRYTTIHQLFADVGIEVTGIILVFHLNVMFSVLMFSFWDIEKDKIQKQSSWIQALGRIRSHSFLDLWVILAFALSIIIWYCGDFQNKESRTVAGVLVYMSFVHAFLWRLTSSIKKTEWIRLIGEGVFFIPLYIW